MNEDRLLKKLESFIGIKINMTQLKPNISLSNPYQLKY